MLVDEFGRFQQQSVNASTLGVTKTLDFSEQEVLSVHNGAAWATLFLLYDSQRFEQSVFHNKYEREKQKCIATVERVQRSQVPRDANIMSSHVVCKIKVEDHDSFRLKARTTVHGSEDSDRENLWSDCFTCAIIEIRTFTTADAVF